MIESDLGEIPNEWKVGSFQDLSNLLTGVSFKGDEYLLDEGISVVRGENVTTKKLRWDTHKKWSNTKGLDNYFLKEWDIVIAMDGSKVGKNWAIISKYNLPLLLAQRVACLRAKNQIWQSFLYFSMSVLSFENYVSQVQTGTSIPHISGNQILEFPVLIPTELIINDFNNISKVILKKIMILNYQHEKLSEFKRILLASLTKVSE